MSSPSAPNEPVGGRRDVRVFRAPSATIGAIAGAVVALALLVDAAVRAGLGEMMLLAPWVLLVLWFVYVLVYAPHIRTDSEGVRVHNLLRIVEFPWSAVRDIELRWQVRFGLSSGENIASFGGPVAGRPARPGLRLGGGERREPPALRDVELIREQWISATEGDPVPELPAPGAARAASVVRRSWDVPALIALVAIAIWAVSALITVNSFG
jgi:hypothetical protein